MRARREWDALVLLHSSSAGLAPEPFGHDVLQGLIAMEWIQGIQGGSAIQVDDLLKILEMLLAAQGLRDAKGIGPAADGIREPEDLLTQVTERLQTPGLSPLVRDTAGRVQETIPRMRLGEVSHARSTPILSPSDFGPHNLIQNQTGFRLVDLEFFGWDDAHKLVADTLLHPLIDWVQLDRQSFLKQVTSLYGLNAERLQTVARGCALKWAMIVLGRADRLYGLGDLQAHAESISLAETYLEIARVQEIEFLHA